MSSWRSSGSDAWKNSPRQSRRRFPLITRSSSDFIGAGRTEPPSCIGDPDGDEEETPSKYYCMWKILSSRVSPTPMRPHAAARTRVQYQPRKQLNFLSPTSPPVIHLDLETILYGGGRTWLLWRRKDIQWSISLFHFSLFLSFSHARACILDETTSYFSLIFMLIGEFPYLPVITWYIIIITLTANINIGSDDVLPRGARRIPEKFIRLARTFCVC